MMLILSLTWKLLKSIMLTPEYITFMDFKILVCLIVKNRMLAFLQI
jgi:hypothetical protein